MDWPSKNVPQGGVFQPAKVRYSEDTKQFLNTLIAETKLTTLQRNKINYTLRSGEPLPNLHGPGKPPKKDKYEVTIRPGSSKRRSFQTIKEMGAYERDRFKPQHPSIDREILKQKLQDRMAFQKEIKSNVPVEKPEVKVEFTGMNRYEELKMEIEEREQWLAGMEELGAAEKHRLIINQQIQERVREMRRLQVKE